MKIKRFLARDMRAAFRMVREEQGPDAVILSSRRIGDQIEVVAALDYDAALVQQALRRDSGETEQAEVGTTAPAAAATAQAPAAPVASAALPAEPADRRPDVNPFS
ncbi:MAG: flagellar biosynthesis protein FlhF, partial [Abyssibacter sp.]